MRGHRHRQVGERPERREVRRQRRARPPSPRGSVEVAVERRPPLPRHVLHHRQHAAGQQPLGHRRGRSPPPRPGRRRSSGCASTGVGRRAAPGRAPARSSTSMPDRAQLARDQPVAQVHRPRPQPRPGSRAHSSSAGAHSRQAGARSRATRPPSWSISTGASRPTLSRSSPVSRRELLRALDVAGEEDEAPGRRPRRRSAAPPAPSAGPPQPKMTARGAIYCSVTGMQATPRARSASHICRVSSASAKPATRSR